MPCVTLLDPRAAPVACDLLIADGRIADRSAPGSRAYAEIERRSEFSGSFVVPALADAHVHFPPDNILRLTKLFALLRLRHGVTLVRDAGDVDATATPAALALVLSGALPGPQIRYADAFITSGHARWSNSLHFDRPEQAAEIVARLVRAGAHWVKSYENLDVPRIRALVAAARSAGLGVLGHVPTPLGQEEALLPDAQHLLGVPTPASIPRDHVLDRAAYWQSVDDARSECVIAATAERGLALTPTLSAHAALLRFARYQVDRDAADLRLLPRFFTSVVWHPEHGLPAYRNLTADDAARLSDALERKRRFVARCARAGIELRLGTDTQQPFVVPGAALHREIDEFVAAGLPRPGVWSLASDGAGRALGVANFGTLAVGGPADAIVSARSPFEPGWSPQAIDAVVVSGTLLTTADLDLAIRRELRRFDGPLAGPATQWLARAAMRRAASSYTS